MSCPKDTEVGLPLSRQYSLDQLCFYVINSDLAYTEYLKKCRSTGILQVSYVDQKKLIEEIKNYKSVSTIVSFDPEERHRCEYNYSFINSFVLRKRNYKIVVPTSYQSLLNVNNVRKFLEDGVFQRKKISFENTPEVVVLGQFRIVEDMIDSWEDVVAVFLDGSKWQYRDWKWKSLREVADNVPTFFLYSKNGEEKKFENFDIMPIKIDDEGLLDKDVFDAMWKKIKSKTRRKSHS